MSHLIIVRPSISKSMSYHFEHAPRMVLFVLVAVFASSSVCRAQLQDDERRIRWHEAERLSVFRRSEGPAPVTVATDEATQAERLMTLDEAIRLSLQHSEAIRVLAGVSAVSTGQTIYDTAIAVTPIDQAKAVFDPVFSANSSFRHTEFPGLNALGSSIVRSQTAGNDSGVSLRDLNTLGGTVDLSFANSLDDPAVAGFLNRNLPSASLSYTQPLLAGLGRDANTAPIVIARLQQEISYFQFKDSMQELVRGTIAAYWSLVQARTELWAREIQVDQSRNAFLRLEAKFRTGSADQSNVAQPKLAYAIFRANLVTARANVLQREAALRNMIGLPPTDGVQIVPSTPPTRDQVQFRWDEINQTAQSLRPDLVELNLILLADRKRLVQSRNLAQPQLDAVALQRWDGLSGRVINGNSLSSGLGDNSSWTMGVNFSVPLSLRKSRAQVRNNELLIMKDRALIQQNLHQIEHLLATSLRTIDQSFLQFEAFREARQAGKENLDVRVRRMEKGLEDFLNYLQGLTDWGNAVASEAQALASYNSGLADLERQTGTILETHGIRFVEEQFASIGTHGRWCQDERYPRDLKPRENSQRYEDSGKASEEAFDLQDFPRRRDDRLRLPEAPQFDEMENRSVDPAK
ncbi:MAG: TolC family protein [Planctomycetota bacterium]|nr:MAG: TolC family protein [Planctomycetota bacterium]